MMLFEDQTKPIFLLDASVLLTDPEAIFSFKNSYIILPFCVIEALDGFKRDYSERGQNARYLPQLLEQAMKQSSSKDCIELPKINSHLHIFLSPYDSLQATNKLDYNQKILKILTEFSTKHKQEVHFITNDSNLRVRASILGFKATAYEKKATSDLLYGEITEQEITDLLWQNLQEKQQVQTNHTPFPNQIILFTNKGQNQLSRYIQSKESWQLIKERTKGVWGVLARNKEQEAAFELLLDKTVPLVILVGKAGTGKTLLALAAAMELMLKQNLYEKILVSRPIFPMGRDMGYLPGNVEEKMEPWMQPIFDNLDFLTRNPTSPQGKIPLQQKLLDNELLELEPLTYIRGRSIPNRVMIVDEAQNLTPHEIKTIITRSGEGTKLILTGDPYQIDNPYIQPESNGLSYVIQRLQASALTGHINLLGGVRSPLAEVASNLL